MLRTLRTALLLAAAAVVTACSPIHATQEAVGRARGADEMEQPKGISPAPAGLRKSPCACLELPVDPTGLVRALQG